MTSTSSKAIILSLLLVLSLFRSSVLASSGDSSQGTCKQVLLRKEWRSLCDDEKKSYIDAVKCLQSHPAQNPSIPAAKTRFDEFQAHHIVFADEVHNTGEFLPWHRQFVRSFEMALRDECGYEGAQPYWDWSEDSDLPNLISKSPVFDPDTGFGGDGVPGTYTVPLDPKNTSLLFPYGYIGCVQDGPFANYTLKLGPGKFITDHCLARGINNTMSPYLNSTAVARLMSMSTFEEFRIELGGMPVTLDHRTHDGGHFSVGGEMSNFYSSPGDPLFYLHHTNLDRLWWHWQKSSPFRLFEISGPILPLFSSSDNVTLEYSLDMGSIGHTVPIRDVMDISCCITYD